MSTGSFTPMLTIDVNMLSLVLKTMFKTDETVVKKVLKALEYDLIPILCVAESLNKRS